MKLYILIRQNIALHSNGAGGTASGTENYYYAGSTAEKTCATSLMTEMTKITNCPKNRGSKTDTLAETRDTTAVAVLIEVAFHDNTSDVKWMESNWSNIATAIANGVK